MKTKSCIIIIIISTFLGCDQFDNKLTIINGTNETIFLEISENGYFDKNPIVLDSISHDTLWNNMRYIHASDTLKVLRKGSWEKYIDKYCKDGVLTIFVFNQDLLEGTPSDVLISKQLFTKKFSYKVKDLEKINWRLVYL